MWVALATVIHAPPSVLWACWCASLDPADRPPYADGSVDPADIPRIASFFSVGLDVDGCDPNAPGMVALAPVYSSAPPPGRPILKAHIGTANGNNHIEPGPMFQGSVINAPLMGGRVQLTSVTLGLHVVAPLLATCTQAYQDVWNRMSGNYANPAAMNLSGSRQASIVAMAAMVRNYARLTNRPYVPLPIVGLTPTVVNYQMTNVDRDRARLLSADLKLYPKYLDSNDVNGKEAARRLDSMAEHGSLRTIALRFYAGVPGCGKTYAIRT